MDQEPHRRASDWRHIDPSRARARRYHLSECRSLFGERALLITWGRIGKRPHVRLETFRTEAALEARRAELQARRQAHGYQRCAAPAERAVSAPPITTAGVEASAA